MLKLEQPPAALPHSRTSRIFRAVAIGYGYQAAVAVVGLALTPFLLNQLGNDDFGRWLVIGQVIVLLSLLDLGGAPVVPREVALASGTNDPGAVALVVRRAFWLVCLQTPLVALTAAGVWVWASVARPEVAGPLAVMLVGLVVQFPLRLPGAVLTGLQDLTFYSALGAGVWALTTVLSVALVLDGWGLYALAVSTTVGALVGGGGAGLRLWMRFPEAVGLAWPGWGELRCQVRPRFWMSLEQLAQVLVGGTDLLIIAWALGPPAAVVYSCTAKLITILGTQCYSIGLTAQPALAQIRAGGDIQFFGAAAHSVSLVQMMLSGAVVIGVTAINGTFVTLWVGPNQYAGPAVTFLVVAALLARHLGFVWWNTAYILGAERGMALSRVGDGLITTAATAVGATLFGLVGAVLGSLAGALVSFLPLGLVAVAERLNMPRRQVLGWVTAWLLRFTLVFVPVALFAATPLSSSPWYSGAVAFTALGVYGGLMVRVAADGPLRTYQSRLTSSIRNRLSWFAQRKGV